MFRFQIAWRHSVRSVLTCWISSLESPAKSRLNTRSKSSSSMLATVREKIEKKATAGRRGWKLLQVFGTPLAAPQRQEFVPDQFPTRQHGHHELGTSHGILKLLVVVEQPCRHPRLCGSSSARDTQAVKLVFDFLKCVLLRQSGGLINTPPM